MEQIATPKMAPLLDELSHSPARTAHTILDVPIRLAIGAYVNPMDGTKKRLEFIDHVPVEAVIANEEAPFLARFVGHCDLYTVTGVFKPAEAW